MVSQSLAEARKATQWKKGQSANPGGRPKSVSERDWVIARQHTAEAIDKILQFMRGRVKGFEPVEVKEGKKTVTKLVEIEYAAAPALQLQAAEMMLERGWGRPPQALHISDEREELNEVTEVQALEVLRSRIASIASRMEERQGLPIIEHEGS